jgi:glycosyltransferase involved in cell wall biosynthesis
MRKKIYFVATTTYAIDMFVRDGLAVLADYFDVTIVTNCEKSSHYSDIGASVIHIPFARKPNVVTDCFCFFKLVWLFLINRPDIVHSIAPKTGLLSAVAASVTLIEVRCHTFTGQVWATKTGWKRVSLRWLDKIVSVLNTHCACDSPSQKVFLDRELGGSSKVSVIGRGSFGGVNLDLYQRSGEDLRAAKLELIGSLQPVVFCYLARKTRDKGAWDVIYAFNEHLTKYPSDILLYLGPIEESVPQQVLDIIKLNASNIINIDELVNDLVFLKGTDILLLPSYREGFGSVVIKAASMGIPTVGYRIYGLTDSVSSENGVLVDKGDIKLFSNAIEELREDTLREGERVQVRCREWAENFSSQAFNREWLKFHKEISTRRLSPS